MVKNYFLIVSRNWKKVQKQNFCLQLEKCVWYPISGYAFLLIQKKLLKKK